MGRLLFFEKIWPHLTGMKHDGNKRDASKWAQREIELVDGTRDVGFWIEGREATVRVELR